MLVLSRKIEQSIYIGDNVKITIVRVKGGTVRLGIEAPAELKILRTELQTDAHNKDNRLGEVSTNNADSRTIEDRQNRNEQHRTIPDGC